MGGGGAKEGKRTEECYKIKEGSEMQDREGGRKVMAKGEK